MSRFYHSVVLYNTIMRRVFHILLILICLIGYACQAAPTKSIPAPIPSPTFTPSLTPSAPPELTPTSTEAPITGTSGYRVRYHPDGDLFAGDLVSIEILAPPDFIPQGNRATVTLESTPSKILAQGFFGPFGIGQRRQATFVWAWNTQDLAPGEYTLHFLVDPEIAEWREIITLLPPEDLPLVEQQAEWASASTACCTVNYLTHTEAERDLPELLNIIDKRARLSTERLAIEFTQPITITLLPRLLGHGGFANTSVHVSYLDRNIADGLFSVVVQHEMVHILDYRREGDLRPDLLVEGLAVFITGGHYRPQPLLSHTAALLETWGDPPQPGLNRYIPLAILADHFYTSQHEIGYLQAGALVAYLVHNWGWDDFLAFYLDIHPHTSGSQARALEAALEAHFGLSLVQLEEDFIAELSQQPISESMLDEVAFSLAYYDTLRTYQRLLDPSAYFMYAWLPDTAAMREAGITADYLRRPQDPQNLALETLLIAASDSYWNGNHIQAWQRLDSAQKVLNVIKAGGLDPFTVDPLAEAYFSIIQTFLRYPTYNLDHLLVSLDINNGTAQAWVSNPTSGLFEVFFMETNTGWQLILPVPTGEGS